jgi:hypothetical protein
MPGQLVDVGGHRLHLYCTGSGSPTVVLEPGLGGASSDLGWVALAVARDSTAYVYDRAGRGWSDAADSPQDAAQIAADLHMLLDRADVPGPYVLAGDSFGGLYVQTSPPTMQTKSPAWCSWNPLHPHRAQQCRPRPRPTTFSVCLRIVARGGSPRSRTPAGPVLLRQSSATLSGRGARQRLDRPQPR